MRVSTYSIEQSRPLTDVAMFTWLVTRGLQVAVLYNFRILKAAADWRELMAPKLTDI